MYHPYMRGKQYELLSLRESVDTIATSKFSPIIEPVRESMEGLERCLKTLEEKKVQCQLITNPQNGDFSKSNELVKKLHAWLDENLVNFPKLIPTLYVDTETRLQQVQEFLTKYQELKRDVAIIHFDFKDGKSLGELLNKFTCVKKNIFFEGTTSRIYQRHFNNDKISKVIINDGFQKRVRNKDHPEDEHFSDLHSSYPALGFNGFGDFLVVGDSYSEGGGPAYTVAIHVTYLDTDSDMRIKHFKSNDSDTFTNPAGKFSEAVNLFNACYTAADSPLSKTKACEDLVALYNDKHFPGLGVLKKISMNHHIELMAQAVQVSN